jgi:hypothetical protein
MILYGASELTISIIAITLSKISFGITLLKLTNGWLRYYVYFAIATLVIFAVPAAVVPWTQCKPLAKTFLDLIPGTCVDKHPSVVYGRFQASKHTISELMYRGYLADSRYSMVCTYGFFSGPVAMESSMEPPDAFGREGGSRCCNELRTIVGLSGVTLSGCTDLVKERGPQPSSEPYISSN